MTQAHILLVDDSRTLLMLTGQILDAAGYEVSTAETSFFPDWPPPGSGVRGGLYQAD
jgi:CheY-like chemotaxis protein